MVGRAMFSSRHSSPPAVPSDRYLYIFCKAWT
jgi:hypothetical protein